MSTVTLQSLFRGFPPEVLCELSGSPDAKSVSQVTSDSRELKSGCVFVAVQGGAHDGHAFLEQAAQKGAWAVVGQRPRAEVCPPDFKIPYLQVADSRQALGRLAANFFDHPSREMRVVGITGTSGKTTTSYLVESILEAAGNRVGVIGTVNFRMGSVVLPSTHTTPGAVELQGLLRQMKDAGCTAVVMEVSSHALKQHRIEGIAFDGMVFTNLSPEHLDFHPDMEDYFQAKRMLFSSCVQTSIASGKTPFSAIHCDDAYGARLLSELKSGASSFGIEPSAAYSGSALRVSIDGIAGKIGDISVSSPLTGQFNAQNILGAAAVCAGMGIDSQKISEGISALKLVPGRLEKVDNLRGVHVLVDYAHKPDALEKVLQTLREVRKNGQKIITVVGCGGDRDRKKRPVMGRLAATLSDLAIITSDNPRTENPGAIISEIMAGIDASSVGATVVEPDRRNAIFMAVSRAQAGDIVLIAGKGHEDYQIIADPAAAGGTRKIHFDDREVAREAFSSR